MANVSKIGFLDYLGLGFIARLLISLFATCCDVFVTFFFGFFLGLFTRSLAGLQGAHHCSGQHHLVSCAIFIPTFPQFLHTKKVLPGLVHGIPGSPHPSISLGVE
jgi:hypothetical protein